MDFDFGKLARNWQAPIVSRTEIGKFSGGLLTPRTLANLDSLNAGPPKCSCGRKVFYPVDELVQWLEKKAKSGGGKLL